MSSLILFRLGDQLGILDRIGERACASARRSSGGESRRQHIGPAELDRWRARSAGTGAAPRSWRGRRSTARPGVPPSALPRRAAARAACLRVNACSMAPELAVGRAHAFDLAALHGDHGIVDALVALDEAEFRAQHVIEHRRQDAQRRAEAARRRRSAPVLNRSSSVRTLAVCQAAQTRPGSAVPPSQL